MTDLPPDDSELARLIGLGDEAAATLLDGRHRRRLESIAGKSGIQAEDCHDVVQEVLAAAMVQIQAGTFRGESSVGTWLISILRTKIADYWRRAQRNPTRKWLQEPGGDATLQELVAQAANPDLRIDVRKALGHLPVMHRLVLIFNQFGGLTTAEMSDRLGRPAGTISRILAESKKRFRLAFRDEDSGPDQRLLE